MIVRDWDAWNVHLDPDGVCVRCDRPAYVELEDRSDPSRDSDTATMKLCKRHQPLFAARARANYELRAALAPILNELNRAVGWLARKVGGQ